MGRSPCCSKVGLVSGPWSAEEDTLLTTYIQQHGEGQWKFLPNKAGMLRCGKSCRLRWVNYLRPGLKRENISEDEEDLIVRLHRIVGNRWSLIAGRLPGRTDNEIKNYWNTYLIKKLNNKDMPKYAKRNTGKNTKKRRKRKRKKKIVINVDEQSTKSTYKVYIPKPTRVSPGFSYMPAAVEEELPPQLFGGGEEDDFDVHHSDSIPIDVDMLEKVYNEYMQLL
ncbi:hypothetical protein ABFS83_07G068300 [Erythranthe nasuta]